MSCNFFRIFQKHRVTLTQGVIFLMLAVLVFSCFQTVEAAGSLTSVKDTLRTSRPSVGTTLPSGAGIGATTITTATNGTNGIQPGDTVTFCTSAVSCATTETKVVSTVPNSTTLTLTVGLTNSYSANAGLFYKSTPVHTLSFTTHSTVAAGSFLISFPNASTSPNDGIPDSGGFDFNGFTLSTTTNVVATGFTEGVVSTSSGSSLINILIPFTSSIASNTAITITLGSVAPLLSPTKTAAAGTADVWNVSIAEQDTVPNVIDNATVAIATIEAVQVTATVNPSLTFTIAGINSGQTAFSSTTTSVTTTSVTVPFGSLVAATHYYAAQLLTVGTNAASGYTVTGYQDGNLRKTNGTSIPSFSTTPVDNIGTNGFGFTPVSVAGSPTLPFTYNTSGLFYSSGFGTSTPSTIFSNSGPASGDQVRVVYGLDVASNQAPGNYQNLVTYVATATF